MRTVDYPEFPYIATVPGSIGTFNNNVSSYALVTAYNYANITIPIDYDYAFTPSYNGMPATGNTTYVAFGPSPFSIVITFTCDEFGCAVLSPYTINVTQGNDQLLTGH
jgi:hypothetical protein